MAHGGDNASPWEYISIKNIYTICMYVYILLIMLYGTKRGWNKLRPNGFVSFVLNLELNFADNA